MSPKRNLSVISKIQHYCTYRERSTYEVYTRLALFNLPKNETTKIVESLKQKGFLNEIRFAKAYVIGKHNQKKWGRIKLIKNLKNHKISKELILLALEYIENTYLESFNKLADTLWSNISETNRFKKIQKLKNLLIYRGWEWNLIENKINSL